MFGKVVNMHCTKMKISIKDFFSKCDQIRRKKFIILILLVIFSSYLLTLVLILNLPSKLKRFFLDEIS